MTTTLAKINRTTGDIENVVDTDDINFLALGVNRPPTGNGLFLGSALHLQVTTIADVPTYILDVNDLMIVLAARTQPLDLYFPDTPTVGDTFIITDDAGNVSSANPVTLRTNNNVIFGPGTSTTYVITTPFTSITFVYTGSRYSIVALNPESREDGPELYRFVAGPSVVPLTLVHFGNVRGYPPPTTVLAQADGASHAPAIGMAIALDGPDVLCQVEGLVTGFMGLAEGAIYYLDDVTPGGITATAPTAPGAVVQKVGFGVNATTLFLTLNMEYTIL